MLAGRTRRIAACACLAALSATGCGSGYNAVVRPTPLPQPVRSNRTVAPGTAVPVQLSATMSTHERYRVNGAAYVTMQPILDVSGETVVPEGTPVRATLVSDSPNGFGSPGRLTARLEGVVGVDGTFIPLRGEASIRGARKTGAALGLGFGLMFLMGPFAWFFFAKQGGHATMEAGQVIQGVVAAP